MLFLFWYTSPLEKLKPFRNSSTFSLQSAEVLNLSLTVSFSSDQSLFLFCPQKFDTMQAKLTDLLWSQLKTANACLTFCHPHLHFPLPLLRICWYSFCMQLKLKFSGQDRKPGELMNYICKDCSGYTLSTTHQQSSIFCVTRWFARDWPYSCHTVKTCHIFMSIFVWFQDAMAIYPDQN